jgi:MFS transporter, PAT family, beta-lactamase induction signal transducer AmpG
VAGKIDVSRAERATHPAAFLVLLFPFGASSGYIVVTLGYLLSHRGVSVAAVAGLTAISLIPQTWKFVWAPVVDTTLTPKIWYVIGAIGTGSLIAVTGIITVGADTLPLMTALVFAFSVASSFLGMATESLAAHATDEAKKGRAGGWLQAGNLGGAGIGGGLGLWVAQHAGMAWLSPMAVGTLCVACMAALPFVYEKERRLRQARYLSDLADVVKDVWSIARARLGYLALLILFLPIGTGAASNLWAAISGDWHASADTVALVNGALGGVVSTFACLAGGYVSDALDRKTAYSLFGVLIALCAVGMALAPRTPTMFVFFTLLYAALLGGAYSAFSAVTLEAIGRGAAATKYNLLASLSNIPIAWMTLVDGWAQSRWGSGGMLLAEAVIGVVAIGFFGVVAALTRDHTRLARV